MKKNYNYKYIVVDNKVIALSRYAGKTVRGIAVCAPDDEFDIEKGKELARLRCAHKIAKKRFARANRKIQEAYMQVQENVNFYNKMVEYYTSAQDEVDDTAAALEAILGA